ncbi:hypothetical protein ACLOJK_034269 [Asimina triloba]
MYNGIRRLDALETIFSLGHFAAHPPGCWILGRLHRLGADFVSPGVPWNGDEPGNLGFEFAISMSGILLPPLLIVAGVGHAPLDVDLGTNPLPVLSLLVLDLGGFFCRWGGRLSITPCCLMEFLLVGRDGDLGLETRSMPRSGIVSRWERMRTPGLLGACGSCLEASPCWTGGCLMLIVAVHVVAIGCLGASDTIHWVGRWLMGSAGASSLDWTCDADQRWGKTGLHDLGRWLVRVAGWTQCCPPLAAHRRDLPSLAEALGGGDGSRILDLESRLHDLGHLPVMVMEPMKGLPWSEWLVACGCSLGKMVEHRISVLRRSM